jgi:DNA-binding transcriptional LysR family regulator
MNFNDLQVFVAVARRQSLAAAALECHQTASALSKALRRLEADVGTPLFDRSNKQLALNRAGQSLLPRALALLQLAAQTKSEVLGSQTRLHCRIAAPAMLLWRFGDSLSRSLRSFADCTLSLKPMFEDDALAALANGEVDFACVTGAVISDAHAAPNAQRQHRHWQPHWQTDAIGSMTMLLTAGPTHPLAATLSDASCQGKSKPSATTDQVLAHDFACPSHSLLCGVARGAHSDGWRDDKLPRKIRYWIDDLQVLLAFVKRGTALAYLPEFAHSDPELIRIDVSDCPYTCREELFLVHAPTLASGWQRHVVAGLLEQG